MENHFQQKTTKYIETLALKSKAVRDMYFYNSDFENIPIDVSRDVLLEKKNSPTKGLVHKFGNRAMMLLSYTCAANCRFCERQDRVGVGLDKFGHLSKKEIQKAVEYISMHEEINEVIFSGGDPLSNPSGLLFACTLLSKVSHVKIFRLHTKFPIQAPSKVKFELLKKIVKLVPVFYMSIHVNHPDELNEFTIPVLSKIRKLGFIMLSQTVFLKGINDNVDILKQLFKQLSEIGVRPYYIYHCTSIPTTQRFVMDIQREVDIMSSLREQLSGIAFPNHTIDLMGAVGKVIVPTNHWETVRNKVTDYNGMKIML
ncbi:MAG: radical SAM protein [Bacteroidetes bacterium]|nr:radical SAM protein [Bacteroidota bacterium]